MTDDIRVKISQDKIDNSVTLSHTQDVSSILESNARARSAYADQPKQSELQHVARIPSVVVMEWMKEGINVMAPNHEDRRRIRSKLNSPEYAYLRTGGGRL
jgi:hypothetical protein